VVYSRILRTPGVAALVTATGLGMLPFGMNALAMLLFVSDASDSFAAAGLVVGAFALGSAVGGPLQSRLFDRHGVRVVPPTALASALGLVLLCALGTSVAAMAGAALAAGVAAPPFMPVLRSCWPALLAERPDMLRGAYALDAVMIELSLIVGPLTTVALVTLGGRRLPLLVSAGLVLAGAGLMTTTLRGHVVAAPRRRPLGSLAVPGLRTLVLASVPLGFCFGAVEVALPAFGDAHGSPELGGLLLAVWAAASALGGLAYGMRAERASVARAHLAFSLLLPAGVLSLAAARSPLAMALLVALAGMPLAPLIASRNQLVQLVVSRGAVAEAFSWPVTAVLAGSSAGAAVGGGIVQRSSWSALVAVAGLAALGGAGIVALWRRTLVPADAAA